MNNNYYAENRVYKQHEQDILQFVENGRNGSNFKTFSANHFVQRIVKQLKKRD